MGWLSMLLHFPSFVTDVLGYAHIPSSQEIKHFVACRRKISFDSSVLWLFVLAVVRMQILNGPSVERIVCSSCQIALDPLMQLLSA
uniref:Uncharacterized protein n=1 Tax=Parascaris univalens TaxID=6257 RepID=A0A915A0Q6_PARUN